MGKNTNMQWDVIIIGAGASGMMAAITAAKNGKKVILLEQLDKVGKKLLATGNGKCNFTNEVMEASCFRGERAFVEKLLNGFSTENCLELFHNMGIYAKSKNGYYYPNSEQASSVVNAFLYELQRLGVKICLETKVSNINTCSKFVEVTTNKGIISGNKLIIATGLLASPKLGSDGSLFTAIEDLGHTFTPVLPALCGFYCKGIPFPKISGVRATGTVTAIIDHEEISIDTGEIQFTDYGLSGIPVFQISRFLSRALEADQSVKIAINLFPELTHKELVQELHHRKEIGKEQEVSILLNGLINQKLISVILQKANLAGDMLAFRLNNQDLEKLAQVLQYIEVKVTKARDYEFAQICTGGIPLTDINWDTMESKKVPGIYFTGEILDVDGICGGYNLHFAWATGILAGKSL